MLPRSPGSPSPDRRTRGSRTRSGTPRRRADPGRCHRRPHSSHAAAPPHRNPGSFTRRQARRIHPVSHIRAGPSSRTRVPRCGRHSIDDSRACRRNTGGRQPCPKRNIGDQLAEFRPFRGEVGLSPEVFAQYLSSGPMSSRSKTAPLGGGKSHTGWPGFRQPLYDVEPVEAKAGSRRRRAQRIGTLIVHAIPPPARCRGGRGPALGRPRSR